MRLVVQKFGGTSVATPQGRQQVADKIQSAFDRGLSPVVVLSAMGRAPEPYATDSLLSLVRDFEGAVEARELDMLMACGEIISCVVMSHYLRSLGHSSMAMDAFRAGIRTTDDYGEARILTIHPEDVMQAVAEGTVPVVAGFQGINGRLEITTLGRGGSDTTAVALGAALRARFVEIYTDVDGVLTADPREYPEAHIIPEMTFEEVGELAGEGAKVVHPRAVELADEHGVPVWVKNTFGNGYGTFLSRVVPRETFEKTRVLSAIAHVKGLTQVVIDLAAEGDLQKARVNVLNRLAEAGVSLDLINLAGSKVHCIVRSQAFESRTRELLEELNQPAEVRPGCAKISMVGAGMRGTPGVMSAILDCLLKAGVEVIHSTDSNITISCLIPEEHLRVAIGAVHERFGL